MSDKTKIEWSDATWNPVTGCSKVSRGCTHCYAERVFPRAYGRDRKFTDVMTHPERLDQPLRWKKPRRIFVNSMSDLFHEAVPDEFIDQVFHVMGACEWIERGHVFQILTKRPDRMRKYMSERGHRAWNGRRLGGEKYPPSNVHLGVSCEDQPTADERIPDLLQTPAAVRFVSLEPLLGPINLHAITTPDGDGPSSELLWIGTGTAIDWVIVGGESGPHARPCHRDWIRSLRDQCVAAGVPFFFKQWGEWALKSQKPIDIKITNDSQFGVLSLDGRLITGATGWNGRDIDPDTGEAYMVRVGKKAAGAILDGREWREFPKVNELI